MTISLEKWVTDRTHSYVRHGGKQHRRRTVKLLINILNEIVRKEQIKAPEQVGKAHVHRHYARNSHLAKTTLRDHYYAIKLLWGLLGRTQNPPS